MLWLFGAVLRAAASRVCRCALRGLSESLAVEEFEVAYPAFVGLAAAFKEAFVVSVPAFLALRGTLAALPDTHVVEVGLGVAVADSAPGGSELSAQLSEHR